MRLLFDRRRFDSRRLGGRSFDRRWFGGWQPLVEYRRFQRERITGRRRFVVSALGRQRDRRCIGRFGGRRLRWREAIVYDHGEWLVVDRRGWLGRRQLGRDRRAGLDGLRLLREGLRLRRGADDRLHNAGFPGEHECRHGSGTASGGAR